MSEAAGEIVAQQLAPGRVFAGRYRIQRYLASGAMGAVFVAEHTETDQIVALKVLFSKGTTNNPLAEAKIAGRIRSKNIVQVFDAGTDPETGMLYLAMELLEGQTLESLVLSQGPLSPEQVVALLAQVASGLDKAHHHIAKDGTPQAIVHRDLKPENLFLTRDEDGRPLVKILDFGIAKLVSSEASKGTQSAKGTPLFMAPEQLSLKGIGPQTDIWALGLIAFFLLTGKPYWRAANDENATVYALFAEIMGPMQPASERARELGVTVSWPSGFDAWFATATAHNPSERFCTASDAIASLARVFGLSAAHVSSSDAHIALPMLPTDAAAAPRTLSTTWKVTAAGVTVGRTLDTSAPRRWRGWLMLGAGLVLGSSALGTWWFVSRKSAEADAAYRPALASQRVEPPPLSPSASQPPQPVASASAAASATSSSLANPALPTVAPIVSVPAVIGTPARTTVPTKPTAVVSPAKRPSTQFNPLD